MQAGRGGPFALSAPKSHALGASARHIRERRELLTAAHIGALYSVKLSQVLETQPAPPPPGPWRAGP